MAGGKLCKNFPVHGWHLGFKNIGARLIPTQQITEELAGWVRLEGWSYHAGNYTGYHSTIRHNISLHPSPLRD